MLNVLKVFWEVVITLLYIVCTTNVNTNFRTIKLGFELSYGRLVDDVQKSSMFFIWSMKRFLVFL